MPRSAAFRNSYVKRLILDGLKGAQRHPGGELIVALLHRIESGVEVRPVDQASQPCV